jgi:putative tryptophan/tyrosine transport system substrate-binding protein
VTHRRSLLAGAATGAVVAALPALAQPAAPFRVGWIAPGPMAEALPVFDIFRQGLRDLGYVEGRNLVIDARWGEHSTARAETHVAALAAEKPHVIVTLETTIFEVHRAIKTIPCVFAFSGDPVQAGFVDSFARPGRNLTGISFMALELVGKRVELLKAVMPGIQRIAIVANAHHPGDNGERHAAEVAARAMGLEFEYFEGAGRAQVDQALEAIRTSRNEAALMFPTNSVISNSAHIAAWSIKHRIPVISGWGRFADEGNLMSYGPNMRESYRRLAVFVDRILKGAKPAVMAAELPQHFELVINLKTAKALGITVPRFVVLRADRVIE